MKLLIFSVSWSAIGLYKLNTIALPMPNSTNESMLTILEKRELTPTYANPMDAIKAFRQANPRSMVMH